MPDRPVPTLSGRFRLLPERISTSNVSVTSCLDAFDEQPQLASPSQFFSNLLGCLSAWHRNTTRSKGRWRHVRSDAFCGLVYSADSVRSRLTPKNSGVTLPASTACGFRILRG